MKLPLLLLALSIFAPCRAAAAAQPNVILLTLDGVRQAEFLGNAADRGLSADAGPTFPAFWETHAAQGAVMESLALSNDVTLSLPAYQSIMAGGKTFCWSNDCGRIGRQTLMEKLRAELHLAKEEVALVASWPNVARAAESREGAVSVDVSTFTRLDADTWPRAMAALDKRPRFLWIALNDSDETGHRNDYPGHLAALRRYDAWIDELIAELDAMDDYGAMTTLIITTDHGRGDGADWTSHGGRSAAAHAWLYARGRMIRSGVRLKRRDCSGGHADIKVTVEHLLGLAPEDGVLPVVAVKFPRFMKFD